MASNINTTSIDADYPIAGQDNNSQGFRDNFGTIKNNFIATKSEIETLQSNTAKLNANNNFAGNQISNADLLTVTEKAVVKSQWAAGPTTPNIQYLEGTYQVSTIIDDKTFLISWKTGSSVSLQNNRYAKMILQVACDDVVTHTLDFAVEGGGDVLYDEFFPNPLNIGGDPVLIELSTYNGGSTMYVKYLGKMSSGISTTVLNNLEINGNITVTGSAEIDGLIIPDLGNISNVDTTTNPPTNGQVLKYSASLSKWVPATDSNTPNTSLISLTDDVSIVNPSNGQFLKYNSSTSKWENISFTGDFVSYNVKVVDDGSGTQETFEFNGNKLKTNTGITYRIDFIPGNRYRFNLNDSSNTSRLKFSTTPDTAVPASITPYTTNVTEVGTAGTTGAYTDILVTDDTPELYFYLEENEPAIDTSNVGGSVKIQKVYQKLWNGSEDLSNGSVASTRTASYFSTSSAETASLGVGIEGQIKVFAMYADSGDMVITVTNAGWIESTPTWSVSTTYSIGDKVTFNGIPYISLQDTNVSNQPDIAPTFWAVRGTITFNSIGQACTLQYINGKWFCVGNNGATFA